MNDPSSALQDIDGAIKNIPAGAPRILLAHSPDIADDVTETRFGLILAGHTHGGQINLPFFNGAWLLDGRRSDTYKAFMTSMAPRCT